MTCVIIFGNELVKPHLCFILRLLTEREEVETFLLIIYYPLCETCGTCFFSHRIFRVVWSKGILES